MAYYDPATDRIIGAKRGTWKYEHELRHRWQFQHIPHLEMVITRVHITSYYASAFSAIAVLARYGLGGWQMAIMAVGLGMSVHVAMTALIEFDAYIMGTIRYLRRSG